jgi:predicted RNase H-like nuclease
MAHGKKTKAGIEERVELLRVVFPDIERHLQNRPPGVAKDDLLDSAVSSWTALRLWKGEARQVCEPERDAKALETTVWY